VHLSKYQGRGLSHRTQKLQESPFVVVMYDLKGVSFRSESDTAALLKDVDKQIHELEELQGHERRAS
jgi:hypothetical protein